VEYSHDQYETRLQDGLTNQRLDGPTDIKNDLNYEYYDFSNKLKNVDGTETENYTYDEIEGRALKNDPPRRIILVRSQAVREN